MTVELSQSVLPIRLYKNDELFGHGSCVVTQNNILYTSLHVLKNIDDTTPKLEYGGNLYTLDTDRYFDFNSRSCQIELPRKLGKIIPQSKIARCKSNVNDTVFMIGYYNRELSTPRIFSAKVISNSFETFYIDLDENRNYEGMSGGGIFNKKLKLVGIVNGSIFEKTIECEFITPDRYER